MNLTNQGSPARTVGSRADGIPSHIAVSDNAPQFVEYVDSILDLAKLDQPITRADWDARLEVCLTVEPSRKLRILVPQEDLRRQGAFFTGPKWAQRLASVATKQQKSGSAAYHDPACGAGDLLLALARMLPIQPTFRETVSRWGAQLSGVDISEQFVRLAKARLTLLAASRCGICPPMASKLPSDPFPKIRVGDSLIPSQSVPRSDVVIMNPPFGYTAAPATCSWTTGRVNAAALFVDRSIREATAGAHIAAILPDVLRSGSRYRKLRRALREAGTVHLEKPLGLFDPQTDVDIYLLHFEKSHDASRPMVAAARPRQGVGRWFAVRVGPVVPHRDAESGPLVPFIHARSIPRWREHCTIAETRRFAGTLIQPPFVCVRRTSRPGCGDRAVSTLILGEDAVAVENHLIVLIPNDGTVDTCRQLIQRLESPKTNKWLDARLRCRHLTTAALAEMPWWQEF
ncbi:MAG: N-6 DNA methylase [Bacteroidota bacterium]|nr:N-6 DNA methylase [Bacteroidota bacterium]